MKVRGAVSAVVGVGVLGCGLAFGAAPASASSTTWIQSIQRPSEEAACPTGGGPAPQSGWVVTEWAKSWEQWPNGGRGGWTCTRTITWGTSGGGDQTPPTPPAPDTGYPSGVGCVDANLGEDFVDFEGGFYLDEGATVWRDDACTQPWGSTYSNPRVYVPEGFDAAALCLEFAGLPYTSGPWGDSNYECRATPYVR